MNYKLKLTMPNGEVLETEIVDQLDRDKSVIYFKDSLKDKSTHINFAHTKGERIIPYDLYKSFTLDVIEVDQPIEQAQPTETTNLGKRVEFRAVGQFQIGIIEAELKDEFIIRHYQYGKLSRFKQQCTILEDQPKSNVGRMVRCKVWSKGYYEPIVFENDIEYVTRDENGSLAVYAKSDCELLPE